MRELIHMTVQRIVDRPKKRYCSYRNGHEYVVAIRDMKTAKVEVYLFNLN